MPDIPSRKKAEFDGPTECKLRRGKRTSRIRLPRSRKLQGGCGTARPTATHIARLSKGIRGKATPRCQLGGMNTFVYRYSSSSSLSTITLCFLRRRSRSVCMLFTYSPPSPLLAMGVEGVGPNCMTLVSSWSLEGFVRFSVVSILSVAVREFVRRHAPANQLGVWRVERSERLAW